MKYFEQVGDSSCLFNVHLYRDIIVLKCLILFWLSRTREPNHYNEYKIYIYKKKNQKVTGYQLAWIHVLDHQETKKQSS